MAIVLSSEQQEQAIVQTFNELSEDYDTDEYNREDAIKLAKMYFDVSDRDREGFFIDFDDVWELCGYSRKDHAKTKLIQRSKLKEGIHYKILSPQLRGNSKATGRPRQPIMLTAKGFCRFATKAETSQGDALGDFLQNLTANVKRIFQQQQPQNIARIEYREKSCNTNKSISLTIKNIGGANPMVYSRIHGKTNHTVMGMTKKQYMQRYNIPKKINSRDYMHETQLQAVCILESASNDNLIKKQPLQLNNFQIVTEHDKICNNFFTDEGLKYLHQCTENIEPMTLYTARKNINLLKN